MNLKAKEGLSVSDMIVVGFALFSMFFGAGNTVFPPYIGMESGTNWFTGFLMFFIGDCGLALMGCFALLRMGSTDAVFNRLGATVGKILVAICLLCVGPGSSPSRVPPRRPMNWVSPPTSAASLPSCSP